jgi:branched-chain amino acid transport system ATP-binding protein
LEPPLVVDHVSKYFGGLEVLADVNMKVGAGERRVLIGPNGAGKTTLFNVITGFLKPNSGSIRFFGKDVTTLSAHRRATMGMRRTFQITNLFSHLSIKENL